MNSRLRWIALTITFLSFVAAPATGSARSGDEATAGNLRFATHPDGPFIAESAVFEGRDIVEVFIAFDYSEAGSEEFGLSVIAPGGLQVHRSRSQYSGSGTAQVSVTGAGIFRDLSSDVYETMRSSRGDADRLAAANFGHQEYILQLQANAKRALNALELLMLIELSDVPAQLRGAVLETVESFDDLTTEARNTDPDDIEKIKSLARDMAETLGAGLPDTKSLETHAQSVERMPIPNTQRRMDQPYDVLVTVDDFAAVSGEFRVFPPQRIFLPRLSMHETTP